mgnify:CR=1 FL=1
MYNYNEYYKWERVLIKESAIFWGYFSYRDWEMHLAASPKGLCYVLWSNKPFRVLEIWVNKYFPQADLICNQDKLKPYIIQLEKYLKGWRHAFDIPLDLQGTCFQISVWKTLLNIPYGTTKTYSQIAREINNPKAVRAVGKAIGANPVSIVVPCHRVIGKDGTLTGFAGGIEIKEKLLRIEGISNIKS